MRLNISPFLEHQKIKFGTSGIRAKNVSLTDQVCYLCTEVFLNYFKQSENPLFNNIIAIAGDLRINTEKMVCVIWRAIADLGYQGIYLGKIPTPALAYYCDQQKCAGIMVTGSHIESDMNGIKFYLPQGEILKEDEQKILAQIVDIKEDQFSSDGSIQDKNLTLPSLSPVGRLIYLKRYLDFFSDEPLKGMVVGVYQHSSVAASLVIELIEALGATVVPFGQTEQFQSVDTEALTPQVISLAKEKITALSLDVIVSTDGDGDRPLLSDENGNWLCGDVVGMLCAIILNADFVVIPITCNSSIDNISEFKGILRTRVGSPYVIAGIYSLIQQGKNNIIGYEANGGLLLGTDFQQNDRILTALPTRDGIFPLLCILTYIHKNKITLSAFLRRYLTRFTAGFCIGHFPMDKITWLMDSNKNLLEQAQTIEDFFYLSSRPLRVNYMDGARFYLENGDIIHLRGSENSPKLRCYIESDTEEKALRLKHLCLKKLMQLAMPQKISLF